MSSPPGLGQEPLSSLAHELKTPLAVITGFAELLSARDDGRIRVEAATRIMEASDRLLKVIDDLLAGVAADHGDLSSRLLEALAIGRKEQAEKGPA